MALYRFAGRRPRMASSARVSDSARVVGDVQQHHKDFWTYGKQLYVDLAARCPRDLERIG